jgi:ribose transport system substrate-binding protein
VRKAAAKMPGIEIVETVHHKETPQAAAAEVLRVNAARPDLTGWAMVGGWPLFRSSLSLKLTEELGRSGMRVVAVDGLPEELNFVDRGLVPVLWAQPTYLWGKVGVETIVDKLLLKKNIPEKIPMPLVRVSRENLGTWARQLSSWGFSGIPEDYLKLK